MSKCIYIYETDPEVSEYISTSIRDSVSEEISFLIEDTAFGCAIDIVLEKPDVIISSFDLKCLDGVDSYEFFKRGDAPIIYYTKTPAKVYDKFEKRYNHIPEDVYCLDRKCSINHMILLIRKILEI